MGIPTAGIHALRGREREKRALGGRAARGGVETDLLRCCAREFARRGAVADACVSCPWCTEIGGVPEDGYAIARETLGEIKGPYAKREARQRSDDVLDVFSAPR
jgi:hypothetical protein